jgi:hypothetical protein
VCDLLRQPRGGYWMVGREREREREDNYTVAISGNRASDKVIAAARAHARTQTFIVAGFSADGARDTPADFGFGSAERWREWNLVVSTASSSFRLCPFARPPRPGSASYVCLRAARVRTRSSSSQLELLRLGNNN